MNISKHIRWLVMSFSIFLSLGFLIPRQAQSALTLKEILKKTESHYQQLQAFTADFVQWTTSSAATTMTTEASGKLYYQKPRKMCWQYKTPESQIFVANQQYAWLYVPEEKQVSLFNSEEFFSSPLARAFFDGIFELQKHFEVSLNSAVSTDMAAVLELIPKKEDPQVKSVRLWIDLKDYSILSVETQDALGNINRLVIKEEKAMPSPDPKLFQPDIPADTVVVDIDGRELNSSEIEKIKRQLSSQ